MKLEPVECDDPSVQQLSSESSLIETARHSNPVVVVKRLDMDRYRDILPISYTKIYFITN